MNAPALNLHGSDEAFRHTVVGASEVAALFDASPFCTRFELWHRKKGTIAAPEFGGNERIEWGIRLERPIIEAAVDRYGYELETTPQRLDNGAGLGGHPDQFVICPERGPGLLEVKTADWLVAKKWGDEPPLHYLLQMQAYLGLACRSWADLIVLVGGNELRQFRYEFRPKIYADIERRVTEFWQSIRANDPPVPDFARDGDTLVAVIGEPTDEVADLRQDNAADEIACDWLNAKVALKAAEQRVEEAKNALLLKIGTAGTAMLPNYRISAGMTKGSPDKEITAEMVGQIIRGRKGYRRFEIKEIA